ncbi:MAG: hypothetical protein LBJ84_04215 [Oscillospiraceae bacterium]|jgi:hypothetical protein|nr:hypothetical protein [Oscillospiraceae bacterium]
MKSIQKFKYTAFGMAVMLILSIAVPAIAANTTALVKQLTAYYTDANGTPISIYVDGERITPRDSTGKTVDPFVVDGTTYLPVRAVGEALGKPVEWDNATRSVYVGTRPGALQYMTDVLPAYQMSDSYRYKEYSEIASGGTESFNMGGVKYLNGFTMPTGGGDGNWAVWNLNGQYSAFSATLCHVDGEYNYDGTIDVFYDGVLRESYDVTSDMSPRTATLDLRGVNQLKIAWRTTYGGTRYGFGNPIVM